jgi:hypothetical protein
MPAIDQGALAVNNAKRLIEMARLIDVPIVFTERNVKGRLRGRCPTVFALDFSPPRGNAAEPPDQEIDEHAHFHCKMPRRRIDRVQRQRRRLVTG